MFIFFVGGEWDKQKQATKHPKTKSFIISHQSQFLRAVIFVTH